MKTSWCRGSRKSSSKSFCMLLALPGSRKAILHVPGKDGFAEDVPRRRLAWKSLISGLRWVAGG